MAKQRKRTVKFSVYVESDIFDKLLIVARKDGRPLSQWVAHQLTAFVNLHFPEEENVSEACGNRTA